MASRIDPMVPFGMTEQARESMARQPPDVPAPYGLADLFTLLSSVLRRERFAGC
jgi:hypothetical protein